MAIVLATAIVLAAGFTVVPSSVQEAQANPCANEISRGGSADNAFNRQFEDDRECDFTGSFEFEEGIGSLDIEEELATLSVCKEMTSDSLGAPNNFAFTVTGNGPEPDEFLGDANCVEVSIGPGEYAVSEVNMGGGFLFTPQVEGQCMQDPTNVLRATGEIQAGETQECTFINRISD
jgi:hypothetical protein